MRLSIGHKISALSVILVIATTLIVCAILFTLSTQILVNRAINEFSESITEKGVKLQLHISVLREDALYLSKLPATQKLANSHYLPESETLETRQTLEEVFAALLNTKHDYYQIRYLRSDGQEIIRIDRHKGQAIVIPQDQLQNKSKRKYVTETLSLPKEELFLSEINLNREFGKIVEPHQEMIRTAVPIYVENHDKPQALIVINYEIAHEFKEIQAAFSQNDLDSYITNEQGDYLLHPDYSKTYGFDLGQRHLAQDEFPELTELFTSAQRSKNFLSNEDSEQSSHLMVFSKAAYDIGDMSRFIAIGVRQDYNHIVSTQRSALLGSLWWMLILIVAGISLSLYFSRRITRPIKKITQVVEDYTKGTPLSTSLPVEQSDETGVLARSFERMIGQVDEAQANLQALNQNLEDLVEERTSDLKDSELKQRMILETMTDGIITLNQRAEIQTLNPAAEAMFTHSQEDLIGKHIDTIIPTIIEKQMDSYSSLGKVLEASGKCQNGTTFPLEISISVSTIKDTPVYTAFIRDITERKRVETMKNEFVSMVSHEIRTPLTSIKGSLGLLTSGAIGELPKQADDMLNIASNNAERLLLLINDILDIQKIESGKMTYTFADTDVISFLNQAINMNAAYGEQHKVQFKLFHSPEDEGTVKADHDRLMQVMSNLLSNAAKFSPQDDYVEVHAKRIDNKIRISVKDHGPGIPEEFQSRIFEKFSQADSSDTRQKGGSGLGLVITKSILEKHGSDLQFETEKDKGTTFFFEIECVE